jgi:hypothetical protein
MDKITDFSYYISFLDDYKIKYKKFEMKDKNSNKITVVVAEDKHSMLSESDWVLTVFNSSKEKIVSTSARNNCDYDFDKNYNLDCVKNVLENLGILD